MADVKADATNQIKTKEAGSVGRQPSAHTDPASCDVSWRCLRLLTSPERTKPWLLISTCLRYAALHTLSASPVRKGRRRLPGLPPRFAARGRALPRCRAFAPLPVGSSRISDRLCKRQAGLAGSP